MLMIIPQRTCDALYCGGCVARSSGPPAGLAPCCPDTGLEVIAPGAPVCRFVKGIMVEVETGGAPWRNASDRRPSGAAPVAPVAINRAATAYSISTPNVARAMLVGRAVAGAELRMVCATTVGETACRRMFSVGCQQRCKGSHVHLHKPAQVNG